MADARFLSEDERQVYRARIRELREQLKGIGKPVPLPAETEVCSRCEGAGWINRGSEVCPECDGRPETPSQQHHDDPEEPF
jgi:DnaJ-class molecular chaperone